MNRSSEEIEREVEATRSGLDRTMEALKEKMTPGQLLDEAMNSLRGSGASDMVRNLGSQVRDNPLPLAMIGAGMAWLMMGRGHHDGRSERTSFNGSWPDDYSYETAGMEDGADADGSSLKDKAAHAASRVAGAARSGASRTAEAASSARSRAHDARQRLSSAAETARHRAADYGQRAQHGFMDTLEREPLLIGALGVAVGAALAAALPATRAEDRYVGRYRDRLLDEGRTRAQEGVQNARRAASSAYGAVREEAGRLGDGVSSLVDEAKQVAKAGLDAAKSEFKGGEGGQPQTH